MTDRPALPVVYDTGALVAAERGDRRFRAIHERYLALRREIIVPAPVLTQAWRDGGRQVRLSRLLRGCLVEPTSVDTAKAAGALLGRSRTADAVDAIVVATALTWHATIVTSDPDDLAHLGDVAASRRPVVLITV
jgi:PIN domain